MSWEFVGNTSACVTLVHDEGYLIHGTKLESGESETEWILEVTDADTGSMVDVKRCTVRDRSDVERILEEFKQKYP